MKGKSVSYVGSSNSTWIRKDTLMDKLTAKAVEGRVIAESKTSLDSLVREGARRMLQEALENEVAEYLARMTDLRTEDGRQAIVRNGYLPARDLVTGAGPVRIQQRRVRDHRRKQKFTSRILPPYLRRVPSVGELGVAPVYLKKPQRVVGLLHATFLAMMLDALIERTVRQAMKRNGIRRLAVLPEGRMSPTPTTARILEMFSDVAWYEYEGGSEHVVFPVRLKKIQKDLLKLLGVDARIYR